MSKKKILITGANNGLGYDIVKNLIKDRNYKIIGITNKNKPLKSLLKKIETIQVDLLNNDDISSLSKNFINHNIDTIVHCAGGGLGFRDNDINLKKLEKLMQFNFYSIFELNKILIRNKKKDNRLNIIHIGSLASTHSTASVGYSASKATLISYNKNLAYNFFKNKVFTKLVIPGSFLSSNGSMHRLKDKKKKVFNKLEKNLISKKMLKSNDLFPLIKFLFSDRSDLLTGSILNATNLESLNNYS